MSANWVKQKAAFVDSTKNPIGEEKGNLQPRIAITNAYTLIAVIYCAFSAILFYYVVDNIFLAVVHLLALLSVVTNYLILIQTKNFNRATNIILTTGTLVVISLFATGGWENTGYLWPFAFLPFAFFLSDRNAAIKWVTALFGGCLVVILLHYTRVLTVPYSAVAIINYFAALLTFSVCILLFQKATVRREELLSYTETLMEAAPDAVIVIDVEGKIIKWNQKSVTLFGWSADEVMNKSLSEIIIPHRYREAHKNGLKHFLNTGEGAVLGKTVEIQALNKNNTEFDIALSISPALVNHKRLFIGFIRDITEKKDAEEKIRESEQMFSTLFYKSPVLKAIIEASTGKYIRVNDAFVDFLGHTKEEIIGKTSDEINMLGHPEEGGQIIKNIQKDGFIRELEMQLNAKNGKVRWVSTNIDMVNLNGKDCFLSAGIDITERKLAEDKLLKLSQELEQKVVTRTEELAKSEKLFRAMIEKDADMKTLATPDGKVFYASPSLTKILGYTNHEFMTTSALELIHPDDIPGLIEGITDIVQTPGKSFYRQQRLKHKNGTWIWCEGTITNMLHEPAVGALVSNFRDISERKKLEEDQALFASIINSSDDAVISKTLDGKVTSWNHAAEKIFGYSSKEIMGKPLSIIIPPHLRNEEREIMEKIFEGEGFEHYETERIKKDGKVIYVSLTISSIKDSLGNIVGVSKISRDISERKKAEAEIRKLNEELEQKVSDRTEELSSVNQELEAFTYSVSHDLRAPLRAVNGYAKMLEEDHSTSFDAEGRRLIGVIEKNASKMGLLIDDLLEFSRLGRKEIRKSLIDMNKLTDEALAGTVQSLSHHADIRIEKLHAATGDYALINHVMTNLLSNAIKYSSKKEKPVINIKSRKENGELIFSVSDNGAGFEMEYAHKLFGVFQRLHSPEEFSGTGVGLAIVQRIISKHGGRVWAEGEIDKGAVFNFSLPDN